LRFLKGPTQEQLAAAVGIDRGELSKELSGA
jgi:transcriptional regulator with XRE-family HTH domain